MSDTHILVSIAVFAGMIAWGIIGLRTIYHQGRLKGMREAANAAIIGVSRHYEHQGQEIPEDVANAVDALNDRVANTPTVRRKCEVYQNLLLGLGNEMGKAAWQDGFDAGRRWTDPQKDEIRIDLTGKQLADVTMLAHFGFEHVLFDRGAKFLSTEEQAYAGARAIERMERLLPSEYRDESEPYALATSRHQLIWDRWPHKSGGIGTT